MLANSAIARPVATPVAIPVHEWLPWVVLAGIAMLFLVYMVGTEQGATAVIGGRYIHEWLHDSRHLTGFPCH
jgi:Probable cobalt transporter subunit (CbtB)